LNLKVLVELLRAEVLADSKILHLPFHQPQSPQTFVFPEHAYVPGPVPNVQHRYIILGHRQKVENIYLKFRNRYVLVANERKQLQNMKTTLSHRMFFDTWVATGVRFV
jgi:hypothetical protein